MTALEVVLLIIGIACVAASFFVGGSKENENSGGLPETETELTEAEQELVRRRVDEIIEQQLGDLSERTEAQLDKISNTKILELNEYADTVLGEINKNHNEAVFLYDMLNEKTKEVKNTVRDVNTAKKELERAAAYAEDEKAQNQKGENASDGAKQKKTSGNTSAKAAAHTGADGGSFGGETSDGGAESRGTESGGAQPEKMANNNDKILELFNRGMSNKEIAKELGLGVGEVRLVVDLYNSTR